jgi:hypothetical protein
MIKDGLNILPEYRIYSRRTFAFGLAAMPVGSVLPTIAEPELNPPDVELLALGRELFSIQAALDHAGEHDQAIALLGRIDVVTTAIADIPATTIQGLYIKALATSWSLIDDFDPKEGMSNDMRLVVSILYDLIRLSGDDPLVMRSITV